MLEIDPLPPFASTPPRLPWGINFGAGTNSWAMALAAYERGIRPDWVLFADTGSETPETYRSVCDFASWAARVGWPFDVCRWVRQDGSFEPIHENCLRTGYLPSKAYGLSGCTSKWKIQPMQRWRKEHGFAESCIAIGYDAGETRRVQKAAQRYCDSAEVDITSEFPWYPLVAWGMDRAACVAINQRHGVMVGKSSCFCCPNMRADEWDELRVAHPDLYAIAERIEARAICAGNAETARLFSGGYRQRGLCACFYETDGNELPVDSPLFAALRAGEGKK